MLPYREIDEFRHCYEKVLPIIMIRPTFELYRKILANITQVEEEVPKNFIMIHFDANLLPEQVQWIEHFVMKSNIRINFSKLSLNFARTYLNTPNKRYNKRAILLQNKANRLPTNSLDIIDLTGEEQSDEPLSNMSRFVINFI